MSRIADQRLVNQRLVATEFTHPAEVVGWLGAVQAQEYALAKWALGLRMKQAVDAEIEQAFNEGRILRTHVMRPTWHFVLPADIRWLLELTAPRVKAISAYVNRQNGLDDAQFARCNAVIARALEGGHFLTRTELGAALTEAGIDAKGLRLGLMMMRAELDAVICSGPRRGKQHTYALLDERAPDARRLSRDEALAELVERFFTGHGPATAQDCAWWSGLTVADVKAGLAMVSPRIVSEEMDGKTMWYAAAMPWIEEAPPTAFLLPPYDEYGIAYRNHDAILEPKFHDLATSAIFGGVIAINGQLLGNWKRTIGKGEVIIEHAPYRPLSQAEQRAFEGSARRFGDFLGLPIALA
jgi:hypothetical protein